MPSVISSCSKAIAGLPSWLSNPGMPSWLLYPARQKGIGLWLRAGPSGWECWHHVERGSMSDTPRPVPKQWKYCTLGCRIGESVGCTMSNGEPASLRTFVKLIRLRTLNPAWRGRPRARRHIRWSHATQKCPWDCAAVATLKAALTSARSKRLLSCPRLWRRPSCAVQGPSSVRAKGVRWSNASPATAVSACLQWTCCPLSRRWRRAARRWRGSFVSLSRRRPSSSTRGLPLTTWRAYSSSRAQRQWKTSARRLCRMICWSSWRAARLTCLHLPNTRQLSRWQRSAPHWTYCANKRNNASSWSATIDWFTSTSWSNRKYRTRRKWHLLMIRRSPCPEPRRDQRPGGPACSSRQSVRKSLCPCAFKPHQSPRKRSAPHRFNSWANQRRFGQNKTTRNNTTITKPWRCWPSWSSWIEEGAADEDVGVRCDGVRAIPQGPRDTQDLGDAGQRRRRNLEALWW